jgi:hypothetical protein
LRFVHGFVHGRCSLHPSPTGLSSSAWSSIPLASRRRVPQRGSGTTPPVTARKGPVFSVPASLRSLLGRGSAPGRLDCSQHCCQAAGQGASHTDSCGMSAQRSDRNRRSWTSCPLLRSRRSCPIRAR